MVKKVLEEILEKKKKILMGEIIACLYVDGMI